MENAVYVWIFVLLFLCAHIGATVANRTGRNTWVGAVLGLTLGIVGIGILFLIPRREPKRHRSSRYRRVG